MVVQAGPKPHNSVTIHAGATATRWWNLMVDLAPCWEVRCLRSGVHIPAGRAGFIRLGAYGRSYKLGWCSRCRRLRCMVAERSKRDSGHRRENHETSKTPLFLAVIFVTAWASPIVQAQVRRPTEVRSVSLFAIMGILLGVGAALLVTALLARWWRMRN